MKGYQLFGRAARAIALLIVTLALAKVSSLAADLKASATVSTSVGQPGAADQAGAHVTRDTGSLHGGARLHLGGEVSAAATVNASTSSKQKGGGHNHGNDGGQGGMGSDGGTAPVPELGTWVGLGSLLLLCVGFAAWDQRRKRPASTQET
ncbi:MAG: hypothetical protein ACYDH9_15065 [Limisphaerales bacterium]